MSPWRMTRWERGDTPPGTDDNLGEPTTSTDLPERRHEALVSVRLGPSAPGSHLVEYLRHEPCAVDAWWIAADVDAVIRLSADSMTVLHRAVADLRLRAGVEVAEANYILRALDLSAPADPRTATATPAWTVSAA
ncbi:hypothetical protein O7614_04270 [Micromonospora sp. WMMD961]|uniref:hypothetical protein n=1 Tax=Micromonospora sp. WMMD961 TaxID=3016100 RepID=UPI002417DFF2|nr:hypothetical protein [Micromonospora sp. WMMD961]MDG4778862.1 hypothetical protein [Micromonospora sp. WMMD961]